MTDDMKNPDDNKFVDGSECPENRLKAFHAYYKRWGFVPPHLIGLEAFFQESLEAFFKNPVYLNNEKANPQDRNELGAFRAFYRLHNERPMSRQVLLAWALANRPQKEKGK